jgi:hypothetical protein
MIAPIVLPQYEGVDFIVVPPLATFMLLVFGRSALFLLVSVPVVARWFLSRTQLAVALAAGHFTAVGLSGLVQASFFPTVVGWAHGFEILATSICYGATLAWLLFAGRREASPAQLADAEHAQQN